MCSQMNNENRYLDLLSSEARFTIRNFLTSLRKANSSLGQSWIVSSSPYEPNGATHVPLT